MPSDLFVSQNRRYFRHSRFQSLFSCPPSPPVRTIWAAHLNAASSTVRRAGWIPRWRRSARRSFSIRVFPIRPDSLVEAAIHRKRDSGFRVHKSMKISESPRERSARDLRIDRCRPFLTPPSYLKVRPMRWDSSPVVRLEEGPCSAAGSFGMGEPRIWRLRRDFHSLIRMR